MLSLLDEAFELASSWAAEKEALEALGLRERAQGFLTLLKTAAPGLDPERALELTRETDAVVGKHARFEGWAERDDVLRDIRLDLIRLLAGAEDTQALADLRPRFRRRARHRRRLRANAHRARMTDARNRSRRRAALASR